MWGSPAGRCLLWGRRWQDGAASGGVTCRCPGPRGSGPALALCPEPSLLGGGSRPHSLRPDGQRPRTGAGDPREDPARDSWARGPRVGSSPRGRLVHNPRMAGPGGAASHGRQAGLLCVWVPGVSLLPSPGLSACADPWGGPTAGDPGPLSLPSGDAPWPCRAGFISRKPALHGRWAVCPFKRPSNFSIFKKFPVFILFFYLNILFIYS